ncbi:hypothetical protein NX794_23605 [Streptomyces sp. LP11]|uniref:DUF8175 domain-containing protein n=1 Tax=Streptomyces pyxinicus TaxID=2970331 RepID=A0ABT2B6Q3_9ACTN|nr:hypothetical protein [Streptomyces sp. LP11]MCS0604176.1 hypothetical protein [Streptomyces sp. LP11]
MARRNDGDEEQRGTGLMIISAVIVLVVVLLGVFVVVTNDDGDGKSDGGASPTSGAGAATSGQGADDNGGGSQTGAPASGGCKPTDTDQKVPTTAPDDVTWSLTKTAALPRSKSAGPMVVNGLSATCYAHTPRGALLAAVNTPYRVALAAPGKAPVEKSVLPGAGRDKLEGQLSQVDVQAGELSQVAGFRVVSYTQQTAVVTLVNGSTDAHNLKASDITVQWSDADWKVVAREDGSLTTPATPVSDLVGYIQFGGL